MRYGWSLLLWLAACSGGVAPAVSEDGEAPPSGEDASTTTPEAASPQSDSSAAASDAGDAAADALCTLWVDDAGVSHGCKQGGQGPGDKDDGGGAPPPPPPDAALDASNLPLGAQCWDDAQCASGICFDYVVKGQFCTQRCWTDSNCPPPMLGCNGQGVCRVP